MKIKINVTVEVDPEAWALDFGLDYTVPVERKRLVREDVQSYFDSFCQEQVDALSLAPVKEEN